MILPFVSPERRDVVADGSLIILGREGGPTRQKRRGKGSGNEKPSTESQDLLLFLIFKDFEAFQRGKVKSLFAQLRGHKQVSAWRFRQRLRQISSSRRCD